MSFISDKLNTWNIGLEVVTVIESTARPIDVQLKRKVKLFNCLSKVCFNCKIYIFTESFIAMNYLYELSSKLTSF